MKETSESDILPLEQRINLKIQAIAAVEDDLPSIIIIHNLKTQSVEYMSKRGLRKLNTTLEALKALGPEYFTKYFNPEDAKKYTPAFIDLVEKKDLDFVFSFFQQVRPNEKTEWGWHLSASKVLMHDDEGNTLLTITAAHPIDSLISVTYKLDRLLEEYEMVRAEYKKYLRLTEREKEIISLWATGLSTPAIAEKLFIAESTVLQHRKNIKAKTKTRTLPELVHFAMAFDLI